MLEIQGEEIDLDDSLVLVCFVFEKILVSQPPLP